MVGAAISWLLVSEVQEVACPGSLKSRALGIPPRVCGFVSHPEHIFRPSHAVGRRSFFLFRRGRSWAASEALLHPRPVPLAQVNSAPARGPDHFPFQVSGVAGCHGGWVLEGGFAQGPGAWVWQGLQGLRVLGLLPRWVSAAKRGSVAFRDAWRDAEIDCGMLGTRAQGFRDSGIGSQGIRNSLGMMVKTKSTVINMEKETYTLG
jgi:hypothetical protein